MSVIVLFIGLIGIIILFQVARTIARLILGLLTAFVIFSMLFSWTTSDYVEKFHLDRVISMEEHTDFYHTLSQWDEWREEQGLILF